MAKRFDTHAWATLVVLAHAIVNLLDGQAHKALAVGLNSWQNVYVVTVILVAPLVALALLFTRYAKAGLWLLLVSMLGSLIFGACYHYVIVSADNVGHLPVGDARAMFRLTAALLLLTEALGVLVAASALLRKKAEGARA